MKETMTVKELKDTLKNIPDEYYIRTRAENAHLTKVKRVDVHNTVVLIRGFE